MTTSVLQNKCSFGGNKRDETISYVIYYFLFFGYVRRGKKEEEERGENRYSDKTITNLKWILRVILISMISNEW